MVPPLSSPARSTTISPMPTATAAALSDAAREFVEAGPHGHSDRRRARSRPPTGAPSRRSTRRPARRSARSPTAAPRTSTAPSAPPARHSRAAAQGLARSKRAGLMYSLAELIKANVAELAELESLDNGKPLAYAKGDIAASVNHLRYYAGWPTKIEGETIPVSARDVLCYTLQRAGRRLRPDRARGTSRC